jgi:endonuclease YncB( thermonuclease family)
MAAPSLLPGASAAPGRSVAGTLGLSRSDAVAIATALLSVLSSAAASQVSRPAEPGHPVQLPGDVRKSGSFEIVGKAIHVSDGDTWTLLDSSYAKITVRMASIDAPELSHTATGSGKVGQPHADAARQRLRTLIGGKEVRAVCFERDHYGRAICETFVANQSVNRQLVAEGLAWANQASAGRYLRDKSLRSVELAARQSRLGLWSAPAPIAPWIWRDDCWKQKRCDAAQH